MSSLRSFMVLAALAAGSACAGADEGAFEGEAEAEAAPELELANSSVASSPGVVIKCEVTRTAPGAQPRLADFIPSLGKDGKLAGYIKKSDFCRGVSSDKPVYDSSLVKVAGTFMNGRGFVRLGAPSEASRLRVEDAP